MDKKQLSATASSGTGKNVEKKDENFLTKTAHSIRDKVQGFTDDVKEKTHNLTHSSESKKNKKDKDQKKNGTKLKTSSKPPTAGKKDSGSDSDDEDESPKPAHPPSASAMTKKDNERDTGKSDRSGAKPLSSTAATERKDAAPSTNSKTPSDKPTASVSASKPSDNHKDTVAPPSSSSKPSSDNSAAKPPGPPPNNDSKSSTDKPNNDSKSSTDKPNNTVNDGDAKNKPSSGENNEDQIRISFYGVSTVGDLLDRIDEAVEKTQIVVENGGGTMGLDIKRTTPAPIPSPADLEKRSVEKTEGDKNKEEPIRIDYNEIHRLEDILLKLDQQPGNRKIVLENAPGDSTSVTIQKQAPRASRPSSNSNESVDSSAPPKSILKTSQDPSSLDTSTKTSSFQDDQIHVNIEGVQNVDDVLDCVETAVENAPVIIDTTSQGEKRKAPQPPNQNGNNHQLAASLSTPTQKREAPKASSLTNEQDTNNKNIPSSVSTTQSHDNEEGDETSEDEFPNKPSMLSTSGEKKTQNETSEWM